MARPAYGAVLGTTPTPGTITRLGDSSLCLALSPDGVPAVTQLACPHRGVHLTQGRVETDGAIVCVAHNTRFDRDGRVCSGPAVEPLHVLPADSTELGYWIGAGHKPSERLKPNIPELGGRPLLAEGHQIGPFDWRDIGENAVDSSHISALHGTPALPRVLEVRATQCEYRVKSTITWTTAPGRTRDGTVEFVVNRPGVVVVRFSGIAAVTSLVTWWPLNDLAAVVSWQIVMTAPDASSASTRLGKRLVAEIEGQLLDDMKIWRHKGPRAGSRLGPLDRYIAAYREWADR